MSIQVEAAGLQTSLQDLGRHGYQHLGVGPGGVMDAASHRLANLLVGNSAAAASLEITLAGPTLRFQSERWIALCGADLAPDLDGQPLPQWRPVRVRAGARLGFGRPVWGARCYLAVAGGYRVAPVMGSASTHLAAGFGGFQGRALRAGDRLELGPEPPGLYPGLRQRFQAQAGPCLGPGWFAAWRYDLGLAHPVLLRLVPGPQWPRLTEASRATLLEAVYRVGPDSNRMGLRLQGPGLALERPLEMVSSGVAMGTVQLPPDGAPILLMADRQTTGGYPRLGDLATVDLPRAAQLRPGDELRFRAVTLDQAQRDYLEREARFRILERELAKRQRH